MRIHKPIINGSCSMAPGFIFDTDLNNLDNKKIKVKLVCSKVYDTHYIKYANFMTSDCRQYYDDKLVGKTFFISYTIDGKILKKAVAKFNAEQKEVSKGKVFAFIIDYLCSYLYQTKYKGMLTRLNKFNGPKDVMEVSEITIGDECLYAKKMVSYLRNRDTYLTVQLVPKNEVNYVRFFNKYT